MMYSWNDPDDRVAIVQLNGELRPAQLAVLSEQCATDLLLQHVRTVELHGRRLPPPPFYLEARSLGIENLPELTHMASLTFVDVIVFNDLIIERTLFHGLVHAVQFHLLGLERYTELFVRAFLRT